MDKETHTGAVPEGLNPSERVRGPFFREGTVLLCPGQAGSAALPRERKFLLFVSVFGLDLLFQVF